MRRWKRPPHARHWRRPASWLSCGGNWGGLHAVAPASLVCASSRPSALSNFTLGLSQQGPPPPSCFRTKDEKSCRKYALIVLALEWCHVPSCMLHLGLDVLRALDFLLVVCLWHRVCLLHTHRAEGTRLRQWMSLKGLMFFSFPLPCSFLISATVQ